MKCEIQQLDRAICLAFAFDRRLDETQVHEMAQVVESALSRTDDLRLLLDLRRTDSLAPGAFLSPAGLRASLRSIGPVSRYAVVSAPALAAAAVEAFGTILPLEASAFAAPDIAEARAWVAAPRA